MSKRVADLLVETLQAAGVKTCYGIVGDTLNRIAHAIDRSEIDWAHIKNGRIEQSNFDTFPIPRLPEVPPIEVAPIPSTERPGGMGEARVPLVAPVDRQRAVRARPGRRIPALPLEDVRRPASREACLHERLPRCSDLQDPADAPATGRPPRPRGSPDSKRKIQQVWIERCRVHALAQTAQHLDLRLVLRNFLQDIVRVSS